MGIVLRGREEPFMLLRKDQFRRNRIRGRIARLGDRGRVRHVRYGGCGHGVRSGDDYGASGEHGEFSCNTAEKRFPVKWHACIPFPI